jgi:Tfp pilus assembly protein PilF
MKLMGIAYYNIRDINSAKKYLNKAINSNPKSFSTHSLLGQILFNCEDILEAL